MVSRIHTSRGFTLIEAIMVIAITGILAGMVAVFIKAPVDSYMDMSRRAELTDVADTAVRRMARDIRLALPNSVRNPSAAGADQCVEFMPTRTGGRYRAAQTAALTGDILDFSTTDASFDMLSVNNSLPVSEQITANDIIVVYNDGSSGGNAYAGGNAIRVSSVAAGDTTGTTKINFVATGTTLFARKTLPSASPANRFQVVPSNEQVVSYACSGNSLLRYSRDISTRTTAWAQPATCADMTGGATAATLATNVTSCSIRYEPPGTGTGAGRYGIVSISLGMTQAGESVNLYHQAKVDNTP
ncbi:MSHA biogenesis protein MshO [Georgfuchsia toluolica]|uniref:MSHA biogenesis protein MshO n=1 Tax=Georgfuchsia toluolica TaxID=424218 RepID=A0A916NJ14_9PROT|nr:type II secretion system protein [Georgfuchsia toluolica]CAG4885193.1 MSHA biogenesis protein MshO [Georgfuchsia toluolica]